MPYTEFWPQHAGQLVTGLKGIASLLSGFSKSFFCICSKGLFCYCKTRDNLLETWPGSLNYKLIGNGQHLIDWEMGGIEAEGRDSLRTDEYPWR